jgi:hypothetical protein
MSLDSVAYMLKHRLPAVFAWIDSAARLVTLFRHSRRRRAALLQSRVKGVVSGTTAEIQSSTVAQADRLHQFLNGMPEDHLEFFHPHEFSPTGVRSILRSEAVCCYELLVEEKTKAYCLVKLFPTQNAYCGLVVSPDMARRGLGKFLWRYMIWQCVLMGVTPCATIHERNMASLESLRSVCPSLDSHPAGPKEHHRTGA